MLSKIKIPPFISRLFEKPAFFTRLSRKTIILSLLVITLIAGSGFTYYRTVAQSTEQTSGTTLQTATVRQGDLVIYASGTGTLIAKDEIDLGFGTGGQVTKLLVKVGDQVKKGDVLAQVDDNDAQVAYVEAKRALVDLTDTSAVATAQQDLATAELDLQDAVSHLQYLISPNVYYWEQQVAADEQAVKDAQAAVDKTPTDADAKKALDKAKNVLTYAKSSLAGAQATYEKYYIPNNFKVKTYDRSAHTWLNYTSPPSEYDIQDARATVTADQAAVEEAKNLLTALTGGEVAEDATGSSLTTLANAQVDLKSAEHTLAGTKITAPFSGTIMSIDAGVGDTVTSSTTVITLADLSQPYLEVYLDASDWANVKVDYPVEVTFDILPDTTYTGTVTSVDPGLYTDSGTSYVRAYVKLDKVEAGFDLPLDTTASVDVIAGQAKNAVLVPVEALHETGGKYTVFAVKNGKLSLRPVEIGIKDTVYAEVKSGLSAGEVVSTGVMETK